MRQSRCCVLDKFYEPLQMREFPLPTDLGLNEILVRVQMAGICGTDVHLWKGQLNIPLPLIMGHETVGVIEQLGLNVEHDWNGRPLAEGDRVTWHSGLSCGKCRYCTVHKLPTKCRSRRAYGVSLGCSTAPHLHGGYSEYMVLRDGSAVFKIPDEIPTEAVVGGGCAIVTAIHGVEVIGVKWGESVVIQGAGPVGLAALAVSVDSGARQTILIGAPEFRLDLARRFGATHVINIDEVRDPAERRKRVLDLTAGDGADVVIECVGYPQAVVEGLELCRDGGRYMVLGHYGDAGAIGLNPHVITRKMLTVKGAWSSEARHLDTALSLYRTKLERFPFHELVSHKFPLEQANEALAATASWQVRKSVLVPAT
jgi:threonine dehydrogenase-like Zn-dependent dehydrogenase